MVDAHCHIDLYRHPQDVLESCAQMGVLTVFVTNLPSVFEACLPRVANASTVRIALGMHPLEARRHAAEFDAFARLTKQTSFIGEVGLDFSPAGIETRQVQVGSFRFVLSQVAGQKKFVSVHSRGAELEVLELAEEFDVRLVLHWYSGPLQLIERALRSGHSFSVNPAMIRATKGKALIERLPKDRILSESDGPFVQIAGNPAMPKDVWLVEEHLAKSWGVPQPEVRKTIRDNLRRLLINTAKPIARGSDGS